MARTLFVWGTPALAGTFLGQSAALLRMRTWVVIGGIVLWYLGLSSGWEALVANGWQPVEGGLLEDLYRLFQENFVLCVLFGYWSLIPRRGLLAWYVPLAYASHVFVHPMSLGRIQELWRTGEKWKVWEGPQALVLLVTVVCLLFFLVLHRRWVRALEGSTLHDSETLEGDEAGGTVSLVRRVAGALKQALGMGVFLVLVFGGTALLAPFLIETGPVEVETRPVDTVPEGAVPEDTVLEEAVPEEDPGRATAGLSKGSSSSSSSGSGSPQDQQPQAGQAGGDNPPERSSGELGSGAGSAEKGDSGNSDGGGKPRTAIPYIFLFLLLVILLDLLERFLRRNRLVRRMLREDPKAPASLRVRTAWEVVVLALREEGKLPEPSESAGDFLRRLLRIEEERRLEDPTSPKLLRAKLPRALRCAEAWDRVRYGSFLRPGDEEAACSAALATYGVAWKSLSCWGRLRALLRSAPLFWRFLNSRD